MFEEGNVICKKMRRKKEENHLSTHHLCFMTEMHIQSSPRVTDSRISCTSSSKDVNDLTGDES